MRCKVGDLAVVVGAPTTPQLNGRIVLCVKIWQGETIEGFRINSGLAPSWIIQTTGSPIPWGKFDGGAPTFHRRRIILDSYLRPIRDNDGEDEVLRIAGKPQETPREMLESIRRGLA